MGCWVLEGLDLGVGMVKRVELHCEIEVTQSDNNCYYPPKLSFEF